MSKNFAFITESGDEIGYGHLYRSIALAQQFIENGFEIDFFCDDSKGVSILRNTFNNVTIFISSSFEEKINNYSCIIFDLYKSSWKNYNNIVNSTKIITASIIDYKFRDYAIETNYIFQIGIQKYRFKESFKTTDEGKIIKFYSGNDLFIFRKEFQLGTLFKLRQSANKVLVSMGGSDPYRLTEFVFESLKQVNMPLEVNYVLGAGFKSERLKILKLNNQNTIHKVYFHTNINNMAKVMTLNDFAIINGGNTRFELAVLGIPFVSISFDAIQNSIANKCQEIGIGKNIGIYHNIKKNHLSTLVEKFLSNFKQRKIFSRQMLNTINLDGSKKILSCLTE